ncbi:MAG: ribosome biogenesis GTP-binding protein YihA/YsxC [Deltaproteobacteria bacterium]|jgi:GTP-binding protein|nr:ribosome biogenesis GTP-binding protein YihA/YsxC [Deltaproteobacteria bacterium]
MSLNISTPKTPIDYPPATEAVFTTSASMARQFPEPLAFEVALLGRSNCGKSSLINRWLGRKSLARVGATPGRTRLINFFKVTWIAGAPSIYVVDLPGYGYAAAPKDMVESWRRLVEDYLAADRGARMALLLMDIRRGVHAEELSLVGLLTSLGIDYRVVATKCDKLSAGRARQALAALASLLGGYPVAFSSLSGQGRSELIEAVGPKSAAAAD